MDARIELDSAATPTLSHVMSEYVHAFPCTQDQTASREESVAAIQFPPEVR